MLSHANSVSATSVIFIGRLLGDRVGGIKSPSRSGLQALISRRIGWEGRECGYLLRRLG
jgi:hypothetical protein